MAKERPKQVARMYRDAQRVAPGLYQMPDGAVIVNATELLHEFGLRDTKANRRLIVEAAHEWCKRNGVQAVDLGGVD